MCGWLCVGRPTLGRLACGCGYGARFPLSRHLAGSPVARCLYLLHHRDTPRKKVQRIFRSASNGAVPERGRPGESCFVARILRHEGRFRRFSRCCLAGVAFVVKGVRHEGRSSVIFALSLADEVFVARAVRHEGWFSVRQVGRPGKSCFVVRILRHGGMRRPGRFDRLGKIVLQCE